MNIAVIGATGMIGHHTARAVYERGHELIVVHRGTSQLATISDLTFRSAIADLNDRASLTNALATVDAVINCAAYYPTKPVPWQAEVRTAAAQMEHFFAACAAANLKKIVYLGSAIALPKHPHGLPGTEDLIYQTRPADKAPYVQVKWEMDRIAREQGQAGLPVVIGIPAMCFGEYDYGPSTGRLIVEIANGTLPGYVRGNRNVIYAGDAGRGLVLACENGRPGERYLFTGTNVSMDELVARIARIAQVTAPTRVIPYPVARLLSRLQELQFHLFGGELPRLSSTAIAIMGSGQFLDGSKARRELHFECRNDIDTTISRTLQWFRSQKYVRQAA
jgi:dihydroflavonol-4-reductase